MLSSFRKRSAAELVEEIAAARDEDSRPRVRITYRFGPPTAPLAEGGSADGVQNSEEEFAKAHGSALGLPR